MNHETKGKNKRPSMAHKHIWLVVSTPLKNISQLGWVFPIYGKNVPNHQPDIYIYYIFIFFSNVPPHPSCLEPLLVTSSTFSHLGTAAGQVGGSGLPFITLRSENVGKHGKARLLYAFITFIGFQLSYQSIQIINKSITTITSASRCRNKWYT